PVDDRRQLYVHDRLTARGGAPFFLELAERLLSWKIVVVNRFSHNFRQATNLEYQWVGKSGGRFQPQFANARLGIERHGNSKYCGLGDGRIGRPIQELRQL